MKRKYFIWAFVIIFIFPFSSINAATLYTDDFQGGFDTSYWATIPSQATPIASDFGIKVPISNNYASLIHDSAIPNDLIIKIDIKINSPNVSNVASDFGLFVNDTSSGKWKNIYLFGITNDGFTDTAIMRDSSIQGNSSLYAKSPWDTSQGIHHLEMRISGKANSPLTLIEDGDTLLTWASNLEFNINEIGISMYGIDSEFANFELCDENLCTPVPTPTAMPTPTATPTPTPTATPTPILPKKVIVIPGYFGSFNGPELLACDLNVHIGQWSSWKMADPYYQPLIAALTQAQYNVFPFYYDWRRTALENAGSLALFIQTNVPNTEEKIDIIAHSFGGLVSRAYIEQFGSNRIDHLLTAGTPHRGTALAYPAWSGGDIWFSNSLGKTLKTLVRWCGKTHRKDDLGTIRSIAPSLNNLLPIDSYLSIKKSGTGIPAETMNAKNTWLYGNNFPNIGSIVLGTLSGTGDKTLSSISVTLDKPKNIPPSYWIDGYAKQQDGTIVTTGDDTVLPSSSALSNAALNATIPVSHAKLLASPLGQRVILDFLGSPNTSSVPVAINSSDRGLTVMAYPGTLWIRGADGQTDTDTGGFYFNDDPKNGTYTILFFPSSRQSTIMIGKFLPNGKEVWKDISHSSILPYIDRISYN